MHLDAVEHRDHVVFMHRIQEGPASRSFGLQVAKLAGVPARVLADAAKKLRELESSEARSATAAAPTSLQADLFAAAADHPALARLANSDPDAMTPREALDLLYELRRHLEG